MIDLSDDTAIRLRFVGYDCHRSMQTDALNGFVEKGFGCLRVPSGGKAEVEAFALISSLGDCQVLMSTMPRRSPFKHHRFPREIILCSVRWYLRYPLSYQDVVDLLAECGITIDRSTVYRWV